MSGEPTTLGPHASNVTTSNTTDESPDIAGELLPELLNIFTTILLGYLFGRLNIISREGGRYYAQACGGLLLPVLLFSGLATIDFYSETFQELKTFLIAICLTKTISFVVVVGFCLATDRSADRWGRAGTRGIFVSQQEDFSIGLPIFVALYSKTDPTMISLLFLAAPISLLFLNPIAFVLMEYGNGRKTDGKFTCKTMLKILLKVIKNPITWSAFLGFIVNLCTGGTLPAILYTSGNGGLLGSLMAGFPFLSQFSLGMIIVGKLSSLKPSHLPVALCLIVVKVILVPFLGRAIVLGLGASETLSRAMFMYCTLPATMGVFLYAMQYNVSPHRMAITCLLCVMVSAPVLFVVAILSPLDHASLGEFISNLPEAMVVPTFLALAGAVWYLVSSIWARKKWAPNTEFQRHCILAFVICSTVVNILGATCSAPVMMTMEANVSWVPSMNGFRSFLTNARVWWCVIYACFDAFFGYGSGRGTEIGRRQFTVLLVASYVVVCVLAGTFAGLWEVYAPDDSICDHSGSWNKNADYVSMSFYGVASVLVGVACVKTLLNLRHASARKKSDHIEVLVPHQELDELDEDGKSYDNFTPSVGAETDQDELHAGVAGKPKQQDAHDDAAVRLVLTFYLLTAFLLSALAAIFHVLLRTDLDDSNHTASAATELEMQQMVAIEVYTVANVLNILSPLMVCLVLSFNTTTVLNPCVNFFKESWHRNCRCCLNANDDPTSTDPLWTESMTTIKFSPSTPVEDVAQI